MSGGANESRSRTSPADSPWFWLLLFSAAGLVFLAVAWPKYVRRQGRLELQYYAGEEITRRRAEGAPAARDVGQEGSQPPPPAGELIVTLWPIAAILVGMMIVSAFMLRRSRRAHAALARLPPGGGTA
jgi:hypothetical protein